MVFFWRGDCSNNVNFYSDSEDRNTNCNWQHMHSSWKVERTAIQYLNELPFWSHEGEEGIDTLGELSCDWDCHMNNENFKTSKNVKSASLIFRPQNYIASPMSVRLPLEGDEGMGSVMNYLTWYTLESSTICRIWEFDVEQHPVEHLWIGDQGIGHQIMDFICVEIKGHPLLTMNI